MENQIVLENMLHYKQTVLNEELDIYNVGAGGVIGVLLTLGFKKLADIKVFRLNADRWNISKTQSKQLKDIFSKSPDQLSQIDNDNIDEIKQTLIDNGKIKIFLSDLNTTYNTIKKYNYHEKGVGAMTKSDAEICKSLEDNTPKSSLYVSTIEAIYNKKNFDKFIKILPYLINKLK